MLGAESLRVALVDKEDGDVLLAALHLRLRVVGIAVASGQHRDLPLVGGRLHDLTEDAALLYAPRDVISR